MINLEDLQDITNEKLQEININLEQLLINRIITGYNWYTELPKHKSRICVTHMHDSEEYKKAMIYDLEKELGYNSKETEDQIRERGSAYFPHFLKWPIPNNLKIKDMKNKRYLNLDLLPKPLQPLINFPEFSDLEGFLKGENTSGWELNAIFKDNDDLKKMLETFYRHYNFDAEESWTDSYDTPVLLIGEEALSYRSELPYFVQATKIGLCRGNNEISFVINKKLETLKSLKQYEILNGLGFIEESCLGNEIFIKTYVDLL